MEKWKQNRVKFYEESNALEFLTNFFNVKKGVRCVASHPKDMVKLNLQPQYRISDSNGRHRAVSLKDKFSGKYSVLNSFWTNHFYMYIFHENSVSWQDDDPHSEAVGYQAVLDIDTPYMPGMKNTDGRYSFFDNSYHTMIQEFNDVIEKVDKILRKKGIDYVIIFSGNGIYIVLEAYYDEDTLLKYIDDFDKMVAQLHKDGYGDPYKVHVDNKEKTRWQNYVKVPFTFHERFERISIPLPKGELDKDWIDGVTNVNNVTPELIDNIIKKANWSKIW